MGLRRYIIISLLLPSVLFARDPFLAVQKNTPAPQILVEARIVRVNSDCVQDLGVDWHESVRDQQGLKLNYPQTKGSFHLHIASLSDYHFIDLQLSAMESSGEGKVIAKPRLLISDGKTALIESGEQIPYSQRVGPKSTAVTFKKAVLALKVTPHVLPNNLIALDLKVNQDKFMAPNIHTAVLQTSVVVKNKSTVVLGGIYEYKKSFQIEGVPWLKDLPVLGAMFRHKTVSTSRDELLVFVFVKIL